MTLIASNAFLRAAILLILFAVAFGLAMFIVRLAAVRIAARQELRAISVTGPGARGRQSLRGRKDDAFTRMVERIEGAGLNLTDTKSDALRAKLVAAGFDSPSAPKLYTLI